MEDGPVGNKYKRLIRKIIIVYVIQTVRASFIPSLSE